MRVYIINALLCAMSICDIITMSSYFIYILRFRMFDVPSNTIGYSYPWLIFLITHVTSSIALHTTALYLSVIMAYIRWTALDRLDAKWINHGALKKILLFTALIVSIISIPTVMVHKIVPVNEVLGINETNTDASDVAKINGLYTVQLDDTKINGCALFRVNLWITGVMFKALPCLLILWFTIALIYKLVQMSEKRRLLRGERREKEEFQLLATSAPSTTRDESRFRKVSTVRNVSIDRTTLMLIIMLVVFLCTEMPQGLLAILSAIYPTHVHTMIYVNVGEVLDLMSLINCLTSFIVYCVMSTTYRATVKSILCPGNRRTVFKNAHLLLNSYRIQVS
uniref:G_PROTEIN_RECEP_F1_2 domain-containing protein n=1 Tax=Caenorhabditis japonica TaxID=281687 RepID=A0A8R1HXX6_CAEJA